LKNKELIAAVTIGPETCINYWVRSLFHGGLVVKFPDRARQLEQYDDPQEAKYVLQNLLDSSADAIGVVDARGRITRWNAASEEILGYSAADLKEKHFSELYADPAELEIMLTRLRRDGFVRKYEINMKKKDGSIAPFNLSINLLYDRQHNLTGSLCIARDRSDTRRALAEFQMLNERLENEITERKKMEHDLRENRETLRALLDAMPESIFLIGRGGVIVAANETSAKRLGKGLNELIGSKMSELIPSEVFKRRKAYTDEALRTGRAVHFEDMRDGTFLDNFIRPIINAEGKVSKLAVFSLNITARKRAEEEILRFASFPRLNPNPVLEIDLGGKVTYGNESAHEVLRKLGRQDITAFLPPDLEALIQSYREKGVKHFYR